MKIPCNQPATTALPHAQPQSVIPSNCCMRGGHVHMVMASKLFTFTFYMVDVGVNVAPAHVHVPIATQVVSPQHVRSMFRGLLPDSITSAGYLSQFLHIRSILDKRIADVGWMSSARMCRCRRSASATSINSAAPCVQARQY